MWAEVEKEHGTPTFAEYRLPYGKANDPPVEEKNRGTIKC